MQKIYAFVLPYIFLLLLSVKGFTQVGLTNATPSALINFSNTTPSTVGTTPQTAFAGVGFSPNPTTAGRLNSNAWAVTGWSDPALAFGGTNTTGDYARGIASAAVGTGGMYAYTGAPASIANPTLMIQPGGSDFAPGTLTLKIQNNGTTNITQLAVSYNLYVRNDQARANSFNFSHSADNSTYTPVAGLNYTSIEVADALSWVLVGTAPSRSTNITGLNIPPNGVYYIRWSSADVSGSVSRDEFGLDDINISATYIVPLITYYPKTTAADLTQLFDWTTDPAGGAGVVPPNFTSPNQLFNLNGLVDQKFNSPWLISGGSNAIITAGNLKIGPSATLQVGSGSNFNFNGRPVNVSSFPTATGSIGVTLGTITNATNVTVERYISSANNRAYRLLAPSVNTTLNIRTNWQENGVNTAGLGTHITGSTTGANGFDATQSGFGSVFTYDPVTPAWVPLTNTNVNTLDAKTGYLTFIRGDRTIDLSSTAAPLPTNTTTLRATGTLLTGPQSFTGLIGNSNFNLVTNPYAAAINWASVHAASTGLTQFYTLWDPNLGSRGSFVTVNTAGVKSNMASNATVNIQSGQAFFVQASGVPSPIVNIAEAHKSSANNIDVFRAGLQTELFSSSLFYTDQLNNRTNADGVISVYNNDYDTVIDGNDADQIPNWDEDIAIGRNSSSLSIESRPLVDVADTIPITMARLKIQNYEWEFNVSNFNHPNLQALLLDKFLNTRTPVSLNGSTIVPFTVTSDVASSAANRFMIIFGPNNTLPVSLTGVRASQKAKDIQVEWTAQAEVNLDSYEIEKSVDGQQFTKTASIIAKASSTSNAYNWLDVNVSTADNYYRIKAISKTGEIQYSKVVRVSIGKVGSEINVYPNPVSDNIISVNLNLPKGKYCITITNQLGQKVYKRDVMHSGGASAQLLQLETGWIPGIYQLNVSNEKSNYMQQLIKK